MRGSKGQACKIPSSISGSRTDMARLITMLMALFAADLGLVSSSRVLVRDLAADNSSQAWHAELEELLAEARGIFVIVG